MRRQDILSSDAWSGRGLQVEQTHCSELTQTGVSKPSNKETIKVVVYHFQRHVLKGPPTLAYATFFMDPYSVCHATVKLNSVFLPCWSFQAPYPSSGLTRQ